MVVVMIVVEVAWAGWGWVPGEAWDPAWYADQQAHPFFTAACYQLARLFFRLAIWINWLNKFVP